MEQVTKIALVLIVAAGLTACGGDMPGSIGGSIWVTDTGIKGDLATDGASVSGFSFDLILDPSIMFN